MESQMWHVSSSLNRSSIHASGLDWSCMGAAPGIAGSSRPEADGIFLCPDLHDVEFFCRLNNTGSSVDVWEVRGVDANVLIDNGNGFLFVPRRVPNTDVSLRYADVVIGRGAPGRFDGATITAALEPFRHRGAERRVRRR